MLKKTKLFTHAVKSIDEEKRQATFVISTDEKDRMGEVVEQSWDLENYKKNPIVLFGHDPSKPGYVVGRATEIVADKDGDKKFDKGELDAVTFGFKGNQVIKGAFEVVAELPIDYYELRELFGLKLEEEDIITYYVVDEKGAVVAEKTVDYMKDDVSKTVSVKVPGENDVLGSYTLCLEVPAVETEVEENPNTGAEAVVGVVAALAVVSVATAAAVSLKK